MMPNCFLAIWKRDKKTDSLSILCSSHFLHCTRLFPVTILHILNPYRITFNKCVRTSLPLFLGSFLLFLRANFHQIFVLQLFVDLHWKICVNMSSKEPL